MSVEVMSALAAALAVGIGASFSALAMGKIGKAAMEGTARQPEAARQILTAMLIVCALVEALTIYTLLVAIMILSK